MRTVVVTACVGMKRKREKNLVAQALVSLRWAGTTADERLAVAMAMVKAKREKKAQALRKAAEDSS